MTSWVYAVSPRSCILLSSRNINKILDNFIWMRFAMEGKMHMFFTPRWKTVVHLVVNAADLHTMPTQSQLQAGSRKQTLFPHYPERR